MTDCRLGVVMMLARLFRRRGGSGLLIAWTVFVGAFHLATPNGVFFTGDATLKLLQTDALIASGGSRIALTDPSLDLDPRGFVSAFHEPSVFRLNGLTFAVFPPAYAYLNVPWRVWFGAGGLHVVPFIGGLAILMFTMRIARRGLGEEYAWLAAAITAVATPVTFYSITPWEHTAATALILAGINQLAWRVPTSGRALAAG